MWYNLTENADFPWKQIWIVLWFDGIFLKLTIFCKFNLRSWKPKLEIYYFWVHLFIRSFPLWTNLGRSLICVSKVGIKNRVWYCCYYFCCCCNNSSKSYTAQLLSYLMNLNFPAKVARYSTTIITLDAYYKREAHVRFLAVLKHFFPIN